MRIVKLTQKERENILENLLKRSPNQYSKFETTVRDILDKVKAEGDQALFAYTEQFDGVKITEETFRVTEEEIAEAYEKVDSHLIEIIRKALVNIRDYHQKQVRYSWFDSKPDGTLLGQKVTALERVGVYVPGGKAVYPSSVLMAKYIRSHWLQPKRLASMRFIKWVEHRQSVLWHMEPKASKRLIRSWDQVIFLWHWPRKRYMDMSALTRSPARVRF